MDSVTQKTVDARPWGTTMQVTWHEDKDRGTLAVEVAGEGMPAVRLSQRNRPTGRLLVHRYRPEDFDIWADGYRVEMQGARRGIGMSALGVDLTINRQPFQLRSYGLALRGFRPYSAHAVIGYSRRSGLLEGSTPFLRTAKTSANQPLVGLAPVEATVTVACAAVFGTRGVCPPRWLCRSLLFILVAAGAALYFAFAVVASMAIPVVLLYLVLQGPYSEGSLPGLPRYCLSLFRGLFAPLFPGLRRVDAAKVVGVPWPLYDDPMVRWLAQQDLRGVRCDLDAGPFGPLTIDRRGDRATISGPAVPTVAGRGDGRGGVILTCPGVDFEYWRSGPIRSLLRGPAFRVDFFDFRLEFTNRMFPSPWGLQMRNRPLKGVKDAWIVRDYFVPRDGQPALANYSERIRTWNFNVWNSKPSRSQDTPLAMAVGAVCACLLPTRRVYPGMLFRAFWGVVFYLPALINRPLASFDQVTRAKPWEPWEPPGGQPSHASPDCREQLPERARS